jgi:hypothetical protein
MDRYSFTLQVEGLDPKTERYEDLFYEAGCDDALVSVIENTVFVDFDREAVTRHEAVLSATHDIERAGGKVSRILDLEGL